jgi:hypothetical protein
MMCFDQAGWHWSLQMILVLGQSLVVVDIYGLLGLPNEMPFHHQTFLQTFQWHDAVEHEDCVYVQQVSSIFYGSLVSIFANL